MAKKEITSRPGWFGTTNHYDASGRKVGSSTPDCLPGVITFVAVLWIIGKFFG